MIEGLIFKCPFEWEEQDCPFQEIRNRAIPERVNLMSKLNKECKTDLLQKHVRCLRLREAINEGGNNDNLSS